jgi:hypothetical protein
VLQLPARAGVHVEAARANAPAQIAELIGPVQPSRAAA